MFQIQLGSINAVKSVIGIKLSNKNIIQIRGDTNVNVDFSFDYQLKPTVTTMRISINEMDSWDVIDYRQIWTYG